MFSITAYRAHNPTPVVIRGLEERELFSSLKYLNELLGWGAGDLFSHPWEIHKNGKLFVRGRETG
jgi:hypothetical protein